MNKKKILLFLVFFTNYVYSQSYFDLNLNYFYENLNLSSENIKDLSDIDKGWEERNYQPRKIEPKKNEKIHLQSNFISSKDVKVFELREKIQKLNEKSQIKILKYNTIVHAAVENYLRMGNALGKILSLSEYYFPLFEEILNKHGIPKELKYLAIIESHLDPKAISQMSAGGLWQFIPQTAQVYNLSSTNLYDDRNDPLKATEAACLFLKELYDQLGDWTLALAAYNSGAGTIQKAIKRAKNQDYWFIRNFLPKETQNYIPKFIAINYIMNHYKDHNIKTPNFQRSYYQTALVEVKENTLFSSLAKELDISSKELKFLNPQFVSELIPKERGYIRLPLEKVYLFPDKEKQIYLQSKKHIDHFSINHIVLKQKNVPLKLVRSRKNKLRITKKTVPANRLAVKKTSSFSKKNI